MPQSKSVTIELTADQRKKIKMETGSDVATLKVEALEDRVAPSIITGGMKKNDPSGSPSK
jgi:hypothetical protein